MNEFEWRRQMRDLRRPIAPGRDLWSAIDAALVERDDSATAAQSARRATRQPWLAAAALAGAFLLAGGVGLRLHRSTAVAPASANAAPWNPSDPRLSGAAIELDAAQLELQQAMLQSPHSSSLQRLLAHTVQQQTQLRHLDHEAG
ncbi:hypothetical protein [Rhodanobacter aciditrophus]|uniref:hypothetical protein n=1 Tax=Rhodanobacter aciditrophus TaxID=1623218 RepID=UPI003CE7CA2E